MSNKIYVRGLTQTDNITEVCNLDVDLIGFDFCPQSDRYVRMITSKAGVIPDYSQERLKRIKTGDDVHYMHNHMPARVGIFADDMPQNIVTRVYNYELDFVQLEGDENSIMIDNLRRTLVPDICPSIGIIKRITITKQDDFKQCEEFIGFVDMFVFQILTTENVTNLLRGYKLQIPYMLEGFMQSFPLNDGRYNGICVGEEMEDEIGIINVKRLETFINNYRH